jgi:hypothetical protein
MTPEELQRTLMRDINSLEAQGAQPQEVQEYINLFAAQHQPQGVSQPTGIPPLAQPDIQPRTNFFSFEAAGDVFTRTAEDISGAFGRAQDLQPLDPSASFEERQAQKKLGTAPVRTAIVQGASAPFRALGAGFTESHQGQIAVGGVIDALTSAGEAITPTSVQNYIGDKALEVIAGYEAMSPSEQLEQRNKLAVSEILSYMVGGTSVKGAAAPIISRTGAAISDAVGAARRVAGRPLDIGPAPKVNKALDALEGAYYKGFVEDKVAVNKALGKIVANTAPQENVTSRSLLRDLVANGVFPEVKGKLADFTDAVARVSDNQSKLGAEIDRILLPRTEVTPLSSLRSETEAILANAPQIDVTLDTALNQVERFFSGLERKTRTAEGFKPNKLNPTQLNQVRKNMNAQTRAFRQAEFHQDVADAIADAVRKRLDQIEPKVRELNVEWARLNRVKQTAAALQFKPINVGVFGSQMGRLAAVTALGASGVATGSGSLVIAGIVAHFGGEAFANILRKKLLSPKAQKVILDAIRENPNFARELVNSANGRDKSLLARELLIEGGDADFEQVPITDNTAPVNQRLADFREGKPSSEAGLIRNPFVRETIESVKPSNPRGRNLFKEAKEALEAYPEGDAAARELLTDYVSARKTEASRTELATAIDILKREKGASFRAGETPEQLGRQDLPEDQRPSLGLSTQDRGAFGKGGEEVFNNFPDLTAKHLSNLEGKTTVSKQFILDTANRPELKQPERDLIREVVEEFDGKINVQEYADKIKARLLPLDIDDPARFSFVPEDGVDANDFLQYENITLPSELRGNVANYNERIYESPIPNSAGQVHFGQRPTVPENYFAHTRIEDMADGSTRRVIEAQSDLFQKARLEQESLGYKSVAEYNKDFPDPNFGKADRAQIEGVQQLKPYRNTWWERIVREEVRQASIDGKTKLQFPTGETAMKIEGLGEINAFETPGPGSQRLTPNMLEVGKEIRNQGNFNSWIITEVLDDGKFKAAPKRAYDNQLKNWEYQLETPDGKVLAKADDMTALVKAKEANPDAVLAGRNPLNNQKEFIDKFSAGKEQAALDVLISRTAYKQTDNEIAEQFAESFDISGKVDTKNPIYRFYEKTMQKYLTKNYGAKKVTDENGVTWVEMEVPSDAKKLPVEAFAVLPFLIGDEE